jgi:hypothetical protein
MDAMNKLAKWRTVLASWQLGTRLNTDAETNAVKDHREATLLLRAEVTALVIMLADKGVFTKPEFEEVLAREAELLDKSYERMFPGFRTDASGIIMDVEQARETMKRKNWRQ